MEIDFEKPIVPNFIRTKQGIFALKYLSDDELAFYVKMFRKRLFERRMEQEQDQIWNSRNTFKSDYIKCKTKNCIREVNKKNIYCGVCRGI